MADTMIVVDCATGEQFTAPAPDSAIQYKAEQAAEAAAAAQAEADAAAAAQASAAAKAQAIATLQANLPSAVFDAVVALANNLNA